MGQFFATNPSARPASGPKEGRWSTETPSDWRKALGLPPAADPAAAPPAEDEGSSEAPASA